jgi:hypothetical protein
MAAEERQLLTRLDIPERAVLREMPDLRSGSRGKNGKRQGAQ